MRKVLEPLEVFTVRIAFNDEVKSPFQKKSFPNELCV